MHRDGAGVAVSDVTKGHMHNYKRPTTWGGNNRTFSSGCSKPLSFSALLLQDRRVADAALVTELMSSYGQEEPEVRALITQTRRGCLGDSQRRWACEALGLEKPPSVTPAVLRILPKSPPDRQVA
jgi:hypothetical protein